MPSFDVKAFRQAVIENRYLITKHAQQRMGLRRISHQDLKTIITAGEIIEEHLTISPHSTSNTMHTHILKIQSLYFACSPESGVVSYGSCQDEALNNLTDALRLRDVRQVGRPTGREVELVTKKRRVS